jgi:ubiquinone biosynthesis protein
MRELRKNAPRWGETLPALPSLVHEVLRQAKEGKWQAHTSKEIASIRREIRRANQRTILTITGASLILSAAVLLALDGFAPLMLGKAPLMTWICAIFGTYLVWAAWPTDEE